MTNEQRVRVDRLERYLIADKDKIYTRVRVDDLDTALSLIKEQSAELLQKNAEIEKKDKIINLMAETLSAVCTGISVVREQFEQCYCEFINSNKDCCWKTDKNCQDCIKQYFTNKVNSKIQ